MMVAYNWFILVLIIVACISVIIAYRMGIEAGHHHREQMKRSNINWLLDHDMLLPSEAMGWEITEDLLIAHFEDPSYSDRRT